MTDTTWNLLCLGDSYTIGEGLEAADSFPHLLKAMLMERGKSGGAEIGVKVVAKTGWTTDELAGAIESEREASGFLSSHYDAVTLLIGVNNQYRGKEKGFDLARYQAEFPPLFEMAIAFAGGDCSKVRVLSIPDWGLTTFGQKSGRDTSVISTELDEYNEFASNLCDTKSIKFLDVTALSRQVGPDASYLVEDGLHYSKKFNQEVAQKVLETI